MAKSYFYNERNLNKYIQPKLKKYNSYTYQKLSEEEGVLNSQIDDESIAIDKANNKIRNIKFQIVEVGSTINSIINDLENEKVNFRKTEAKKRNYNPPEAPDPDNVFKIGNVIPAIAALIIAPVFDKTGYWPIAVPIWFLIIKIFTWYFFFKYEENRIADYNLKQNKYFESIDQEFEPSKSYLQKQQKIPDLEEKKLSYQNEEIELQKEIRRRKFEIVLLKKVIKELPRFKKKAADKEKTAKVNAMEKKNRYGAQGIKNKLLNEVKNKKKWKCPYCDLNDDLDSSVADHIHPVNKGGLSVIQNMVLICKKCNSDKSNLLLRKFCKKKDFDFDEICDRLEKLGKDI